MLPYHCSMRVHFAPMSVELIFGDLSSLILNFEISWYSPVCWLESPANTSGRPLADMQAIYFINGIWNKIQLSRRCDSDRAVRFRQLILRSNIIWRMSFRTTRRLFTGQPQVWMCLVFTICSVSSFIRTVLLFLSGPPREYSSNKRSFCIIL